MDKWKSTWAYETLDFQVFQSFLSEETQRIIVKNNLSGSRIRLHFSNKYGIDTLRFEKIVVSVSRDMITSEIPRNIRITFGGEAALLLKPGEEAVSDEVSFEVQAGEMISVTTYLKDTALVSSGVTSYPNPMIRVYNSVPGDYTDVPYFPYKSQLSYLRPVKEEPEVSFVYGLNRIELLTGEAARTVVCFGDSITHQSRWTSVFADRMYRAFPGKVSVLNAGIGGNRILHDGSILSGYGGCFGEAGIRRFEQDVFGKGEVDFVIVAHGINDIMQPAARYAPADEAVTAEKIIEGLKFYAEVCKTKGVPSAAATITPYYNFVGSWKPEQETVRQTVNQWIRGNTVFDGVIDFDAVMRDPENPKAIRKEYDSGDNIHPGQAGGIAMAKAIDLDRIMEQC